MMVWHMSLVLHFGSIHPAIQGFQAIVLNVSRHQSSDHRLAIRISAVFDFVTGRTRECEKCGCPRGFQDQSVLFSPSFEPSNPFILRLFVHDTPRCFFRWLLSRPRGGDASLLSADKEWLAAVVDDGRGRPKFQ